MSSTTTLAPSPTARPSPPPDGDVSKGPVILTVTVVTTSLALVAVGLRIFVRTTIVRGVGWDDYAILAAAALATTVLGFEIAAVSHGLGRHSFFLDKADAVLASKWSRSAVPPNLTASLLARISLCLFLLRIVDRRRKHKIFLWTVMALTTVTTLVSALNSLLGCRPVEKMWNKDIVGECSPQRVAVIVGITQTTAAILADWLVALFPILLIKDLNMARKTKIALGILMGLGVFVGAAALIKAQQLYTLGSRIDTTWDTVSLTCWSIVEQNVGILAVSIPPCRPLFRHFFKIGSSNDRYQRHRGYDMGNLALAGRPKGHVYPNAVSPASACKPPAGDQGSESSLVQEHLDGAIIKTVSVSLHSQVYDTGDVYPGRVPGVARDRSWYRD